MREKKTKEDGSPQTQMIAFVIEFDDGVLTNRKVLINRALVRYIYIDYTPKKGVGLSENK